MSGLKKVSGAGKPATGMLQGRLRIRVKPCLSGLSGRIQQFDIGVEIRKSQQRSPRLLGAHEFTGTAQPQVLPCDFKAVRTRANDGKALFADHREIRSIKKQAEALHASTADATAQLM